MDLSISTIIIPLETIFVLIYVLTVCFKIKRIKRKINASKLVLKRIHIKVICINICYFRFIFLNVLSNSQLPIKDN